MLVQASLVRWHQQGTTKWHDKGTNILPWSSSVLTMGVTAKNTHIQAITDLFQMLDTQNKYVPPPPTPPST